MAAQPTAIDAHPDAIEVTWSDGARQRIPIRTLREACPCAACSGAREDGSLAVEEEGLRVVGMQVVGAYAVSFDFSDGHSQGIYPFTRLRSLAE